MDLCKVIYVFFFLHYFSFKNSNHQFFTSARNAPGELRFIKWPLKSKEMPAQCYNKNHTK